MRLGSGVSRNRRRLAAALVGMPVLAWPPRVTAQAKLSRSAPTLNVKDFGAFGNGKLPDLRQVRAAIEKAAQHPAGAVVYFPPGDYYLGLADDQYLVEATKLQNVRFVGERATISCRSVQGQSSMLVLEGCRNITIEGLTFRDHGLKREIDWLGSASIRLANESGVACENVQVSDCTFDSVLSALVCRETRPTVRSRDITLRNLSISRSYYGLSFQHNGDNVVARGIRCNDVKRSYYPYGISNHDIEVEAINNATGFTDILISCYRRDTTDVRVKVRSRGKRSGDCILNLDHQNEVPNLALRNISVDLDVDDADCRLDTAIMFRALDKARRLEPVTNRQWQNIRLDGDILICNRTSLFDIRSASRTPGVLHISPRLARHPRLPRAFPGFNVDIAPT